jgi:hypothetical protein
MLVATMVEHFLHVESDPPPGRPVQECRYCLPDWLLTVWLHDGAGHDWTAATFLRILAIWAPFK